MGKSLSEAAAFPQITSLSFPLVNGSIGGGIVFLTCLQRETSL